MSEEDLTHRSKEILDYIKGEGFNVFYSEELTGEYDLVEALWDKPDQWKDFFTVAKNEGIKTIIVNIQTFDSEHAFDSVSHYKDEEGKSVKEILSEESEDVDLEQLAEFNGKVGSFEFAWIKDKIKYNLTKTTDWYSEFKLALSDLESEFSNRQRLIYGGSGGSVIRGRDAGMRDQIPKILQEKSEDELVNELVTYVKKELPTFDYREYYPLKQMFWAEKGVERFSLNPKTDLIRQRIEVKAEKILSDEQSKIEKEKLPKLTDDCVSWCRENGLRRATQADVGAFLNEKEISLSRDGQRALYQKVNVVLRAG